VSSQLGSIETDSTNVRRENIFDPRIQAVGFGNRFKQDGPTPAPTPPPIPPEIQKRFDEQDAEIACASHEFHYVARERTGIPAPGSAAYHEACSLACGCCYCYR